MIERITPFVAGYRGQLYCLPQENNNQINWYHNMLPLNFSALDAQLSNDKTSITFYNISGRLHNGVYSCENILGNGQVVQSIDNALVSVVGKLNKK